MIIFSNEDVLQVDIVSFFDRKNIYDVMQTLQDIGVSKKAARVMFKLNEKTEVAVKTAGGLSDTAYVGDCIGQGTAGGALVSQANLDNGLMLYFGESEGMQYGNVKIQPLAYQDDILKGNKDVVDTQVGNIKLAAMLTEKGLEAHPDKTGFIVCGSGGFKQKVKDDMKEHQLTFGDFSLKEKLCDKYLGQMIHSGGLEESALATVKDRAGRMKGATMEIKSIIEEYQMQALGGMMAAWELWERALLPSLLSGAGTWFGDYQSTVNLCDELQNFFWRVMLKVPESCPKVALRCETRMLGMKWRIWQEKILLLLRIKNHDMDSLCRQVYEEGRINDVIVSKNVVKNDIFEHHYNDMVNTVKEKSKMDDIKEYDFKEVQP